MPLLSAADLQDDLLTATHELDRLQALLAHACDELLHGFQDATRHIGDSAFAPEAPGDVMHKFGPAITALQFQDMASQLIAHTHQRLCGCVERVARDFSGRDGRRRASVEAALPKTNPVAQDAMRAGSIELF